MGNAIGKGNRHWFLIFLWLELYAMVASGVMACVQLHSHVSTRGDAHSIATLVRARVRDGTLISGLRK